MVRVKICGHKSVDDIIFSAEAGAHAVGVIYGFPESPRNNGLGEASRLLERVPGLTERVLVTNASGLKTADKLGVRTVQLIAQPRRLLSLKASYPSLKLIPVLYIERKLPKPEVMKIFSDFDVILLDTKDGSKAGGTGKSHDWTISRRLTKELGRVVLAGGLNPENLEEAVCTVEPYAVDVSSGVESSPGVKDHLLVKAFVRRAMEIG